MIPKRFVFLLLDCFSALDLSTAIEALKEANRVERTNRYTWVILSEDGNTVTASNGMRMDVDLGLTDLDRRDTLVVLGGEDFVAVSTLPVLAWLRRQARFGLVIGGISSAVFTLLKADVLKEEEISAHWALRPALQETFRDLEVGQSVFRLTNNRFTCAGGMATMDLMLQLLARDHGVDLATRVADQMVCTTPRTAAHEQKISLCSRIGTRNDKVAEAIQIMTATLETPASPSQIAETVGISTRQLERLFTKYLNASPKVHYMKLRLEHARCLLLQTNMKTIEVGLASGFNGASHFSKVYKKHFGISPYHERGVQSGGGSQRIRHANRPPE